MRYSWDSWTNPRYWDEILEQNEDILYDGFSQAAAEWAESEKNKNSTIGEARAQQELAFREELISVKSEKVGKSEKFFWITVNPKKDVSLSELIKATEKTVLKKWVQTFAYVYETTAMNHIHSHILIKSTYEVARARKEVANTIKHICDTNNVHCYKFVVLDEEAAKQKLDYMLGKKQPKKLDNVEITKQWRKDNELKEIYTSEGLISC